MELPTCPCHVLLAVMITGPGPPQKGVDVLIVPAGIMGCIAGVEVPVPLPQCAERKLRVNGPKKPLALEEAAIPKWIWNAASALAVSGPKKPVLLAERNPSPESIC